MIVGRHHGETSGAQQGCGSGTCTCAGSAAASTPVGASAAAIETTESTATTEAFEAIATVNGVALYATGQRPDDAALRQLAYGELLRQEAKRLHLVDGPQASATPGNYPDAVTAAIEALLTLELNVPPPDEASCRRYYDQNPGRFRAGEQVELRHILFAVTPGVDVARLSRRAEAALLDARCHVDDGDDPLPALARELSNCPTGADGGRLGWLAAGDCVPEFAQEIFNKAEVGVLPRLVHSRYGLHVVQVLARQPGQLLAYDSARAAVAQRLQQQSYITAVRQYLARLAAAADIRGVDLDRAGSPLVQ